MVFSLERCFDKEGAISASACRFPANTAMRGERLPTLTHDQKNSLVRSCLITRYCMATAAGKTSDGFRSAPVVDSVNAIRVPGRDYMTQREPPRQAKWFSMLAQQLQNANCSRRRAWRC